jgi:transposase
MLPTSLRKKRQHRMVLIDGFMKKLLHIVFRVLKHKTPFNPHIYQINP